MPELGPVGRGGARRRTRRRMTAASEMSKSDESNVSQDTDKLEQLAKLLLDKGVITEDEFNIIFS
jgi:hypothetical protein